MNRYWRIILVVLVVGAALLGEQVQGAGLPSKHQKQMAEKAYLTNNDYPDWRSPEPFSVNNLRLAMTGAEIGEVLGEAGRTIDEGFNVYGDNIVVRLRDGLAVNISVSGDIGSWKLFRDGIVYAEIGDSRTQVDKRLGPPFARYVRSDKPWEILLYSARSGDVGLFMINDQVAGFMLTEPGLLGFSLQYKGFKIADD